MKGVIVILSGPSGAGKGRICEELLKRRDNIRKVVSVTTRNAREEEKGKDSYVFVTEEHFVHLKNSDMFIETNYYDGAWYGTKHIPVEELVIHDLVFDKDVNGALAIKERYPEAVTIYIMPKNNEILLKRRGNRGAQRAQIAIDEVEKAKLLDFLVINDSIDDAVDQVEQIIELVREYNPVMKLFMKNKANIDFMDRFYK